MPTPNETARPAVHILPVVEGGSTTQPWPRGDAAGAVQSNRIHELGQKVLDSPHLTEAYRSSTLRLYHHRLQAIAEVPGFEPLRERARALKREVITHLDFYLGEFADNVEREGGEVHWAADSAEACSLVIDIARRADVRDVVKAKTMVSEEIELNHALEAAGLRAVESDLGEYILQLAHESPAHIVAPAIHKTRAEVADLFEREVDSKRAEAPEELTAVARRALRAVFARAGVGLSGANFAVAETGSVVLVENEGNIRFCTTAPPVHVALVGIEKLIPRFQDLAVFLRLLGRSGTGQKLTSYTSILTGPRRPGEDGPDEMHVVLIDNGRTRALADEKMREALHCIRCGACLNACPVYRRIGGHAYGWVYSGPIGALITPEFAGLAAARELPFASSLCGACREVCPVKINIPDLLLHLRSLVQQTIHTPKPAGSLVQERTAMRFWAWVMTHPRRYAWAARLARRAQPLFARRGWIRSFPAFPISRWTAERDLPALASKPFRSRWRGLDSKGDPQ
ncbi:MAG TPA: LutB/LldF family L-lactate oxidation iron-sulfur protein [Terriglobia bacterium]|nr:LutB/LldF family L-lactate oxidation iron-sulfur protein [Terriglobia bacterium]